MKLDYPRPEEERELSRLWQLVFGDSEEFLSHFFATAYSSDHCRCVTVESRVAAALYWLDCEYRGQKLGYVYAVATHPDHRGRGLCRTLMEDTHVILRERGYAAAMLTPAEVPLRQMYGRLGYRDCCTVAERSCAAGEAVPLRQVTGEEYGKLRRKFLPEGGVLQEGRNLHFLEGYCGLWAGEDFLLAADIRDGHLLAMELLGNGQAAPGILGALNCREGTFRMPGREKEFTMFCPLAPGVEAPDYFGLAFD